MFRFKRSVPVSYDWQGLIYFYSRLYDHLPEKHREKIRNLCEEAGMEYSKALFVLVTTSLSMTAVCDRYYLSQSTLQRAVRRYYKLCKEQLFRK